MGTADLRVSDMGSGSSDFDAGFPTLAIGAGSRLLVAWTGNDDAGGLAATEVEAFGQLLDLNLVFFDGLESAGFSAWAFHLP